MARGTDSVSMTLRCAMRGSFQVVIVPRYMSAITGPVSRSGLVSPGRLYETVVAASAQGTWTHSLQASPWSGVSGASLAPMSTVRAVICSMPPPLPIALYATVTPFAAEYGLCHWPTNGATRLLPAPTSVVDCVVCAPATLSVEVLLEPPQPVATASVTAAAAAPMSVVFFCMRSVSPWSASSHGRSGRDPVTDR